MSIVHGISDDTSLAAAVEGLCDGLWYDVTRAVANAYSAKHEWTDLAKNVAPSPAANAGKLMLEHLGEATAAAKLEQAVADIIAEGKDVTCDMKANRNDPTAVGTQHMAETICRRMRQL
ncbi:MAG: hypothetical protein WKF77_14350 [Planctomycetaceae bacterium]